MSTIRLLLIPNLLICNLQFSAFLIYHSGIVFQAAWVCQCDSALVARLEADFKSTLQQGNSLEQWAAWLKAVVSTVLKPYQGRPDFTKAARQLLLKWSFYSSMVIR